MSKYSFALGVLEAEGREVRRVLFDLDSDTEVEAVKEVEELFNGELFATPKEVRITGDDFMVSEVSTIGHGGRKGTPCAFLLEGVTIESPVVRKWVISFKLTPTNP